MTNVWGPDDSANPITGPAFDSARHYSRAPTANMAAINQARHPQPNRHFFTTCNRPKYWTNSAERRVNEWRFVYMKVVFISSQSDEIGPKIHLNLNKY